MATIARGPLTVDASVFVRAAIPGEHGSEESARFIAALAHSRRPVFLPTLVKPEVAGALIRGLRDPRAARVVLQAIEGLADTVFVPLDATLAEETAELALQTALRGSDAVYAATARRFDAILVTLDAQQRDRLPADITVCSPAEFLEG